MSSQTGLQKSINPLLYLNMNYNQLLAEYRRQGIKLTKYGRVKEGGRNFDLYKIIVGGGEKTLLITAGFHGEEFNAAVSLVKMIKPIIRRAQSRGINLLIYPCVNPSGFDRRERYNLSGETQNNFMMLYKVAPNRWADVLLNGQKPIGFKMRQSDAKEAWALQADLKKLGLFKKLPSGVIDLHQDDDLPTGDFYAYVYDRRGIYEKIMTAAEKYGRRARQVTAFNFEGGVKVKYYIDSRGFLALHDCTLTDLFWRLGVPYSVAFETGVQVPLSKVVKINRVWIERMIDLAAGA